jgi:hypothetical protein
VIRRTPFENFGPTPQVCLVGAGIPYPPNEYQLPTTSRSKVLNHARISVPFGPTRCLLKRPCRLHPPVKYEPGICDPLQKLLTYKIYSYCFSDLINMHDHEHAYSLITVNFGDTSVSGPLLSKPPDEASGLASVVCVNGRFVNSRRSVPT